jgi:hypothetical protein
MADETNRVGRVHVLSAVHAYFQCMLSYKGTIGNVFANLSPFLFECLACEVSQLLRGKKKENNMDMNLRGGR